MKGAISFWKDLYKTNALTELSKLLDNASTTTTEVTNKIETPVNNNTLKKYQITTESISTIFNTKRPFTRVFYATSKDEAYDKFIKWMSERQLHENKSKTVITELTQEGEDGRENN